MPDESSSPVGEGSLSAAEQAFLSKYLGITTESPEGMDRIKPVVPEQVMGGVVAMEETAARERPSPPPPSTAASPARDAVKLSDTVPAEKALREQTILQLIGFRIADQEYSLPIDVIQEVIRAVEPTRLPSAPTFLSGVINLRGKVTPLVSLRTLLRLPPDEDKFVVVCRHSGLQLGLQIQAVSTMHRVRQDRIEWGIDSLLGVQNDFISGLIRTEDRRLIGILSLDHLVQTLLKP